MEPYTLLASQETYQGKIINVTQDTISLPDGNRALREVVWRGPAAMVLPVDPEGSLLFVRQYRHPIRDLSLEIPAGMAEEGEAPEACAARELEEETGYKAGSLRLLFSVHGAIGFCTEVTHIFLAEQLTPGTLHPDPEEFVTLERYTPKEAAALALTGGITDVKTIAAVLAYLAIEDLKDNEA